MNFPATIEMPEVKEIQPKKTKQIRSFCVDNQTKT